MQVRPRLSRVRGWTGSWSPALQRQGSASSSGQLPGGVGGGEGFQGCSASFDCKQLQPSGILKAEEGRTRVHWKLPLSTFSLNPDLF